jgi:hypothetical protein
MGAFCLILDGPDGEAVLRDHARLAAPYERIGLDDGEARRDLDSALVQRGDVDCAPVA